MALVACNAAADWHTLCTLTYPAEWPSDGKKVKADLNRFLVWWRERFGGNYLWFLEFQERGAPHFHFLFSVELPADRTPRWRSGKAPAQTHVGWEDEVREAWRRAISADQTPHVGPLVVALEVIRDADGGAKYAATYARKPKQKQVPEGFTNVGRFWGCDRETGRLSWESHPLCSRELLAIVGDEGVSAWGEFFKVQHGRADDMRQFVAARASAGAVAAEPDERVVWYRGETVGPAGGPPADARTVPIVASYAWQKPRSRVYRANANASRTATDSPAARGCGSGPGGSRLSDLAAALTPPPARTGPALFRISKRVSGAGEAIRRTAGLRREFDAGGKRGDGCGCDSLPCGVGHPRASGEH